MKVTAAYSGMNFTEQETPFQVALYDNSKRDPPGPMFVAELDRKTFLDLFRRMENVKAMADNQDGNK